MIYFNNSSPAHVASRDEIKKCSKKKKTQSDMLTAKPSEVKSEKCATLHATAQKKRELRQLTKNAFDLRVGNVDDLLNFDDLFHHLWHWHINDMFNDSHRFSFHFTVQSPQHSSRRATLRNMGTLKSTQVSSCVYVLVETLTFREPTWRLFVHSIRRSAVLEPSDVLPFIIIFSSASDVLAVHNQSIFVGGPMYTCRAPELTSHSRMVAISSVSAFCCGSPPFSVESLS